MAQASSGAKSVLMLGVEQQNPLANIGFPNAGLIAANFGLVQFPIDPGEVFARNDASVTPNELTGTLGMPIAIPTRASYPFTPNGSLRTSTIVPLLASMIGKPVKTQDGSAAAYKYVYSLSDAFADSVSLWGTFHKAGSTTPVLFGGAKIGSLEFSSNGSTEVGYKAVGRGAWDTETGFGIPDVGNTGTYAHAPVFSGNRTDTNKYTDSITLQITSAPTSGTFKYKVKVGSGALSTLETSVAYSTVTKLQTSRVEVLNDAGALGIDSGEIREPLNVYFPGDVSGLLVGDKFVLPAVCQICGDAAGETGVARTKLAGPRFGAPHVTIKRGTSSADTLLDFEAGTVKLTRTITEAYTHGPNARNPYDMDVTGYLGVEIDTDRRFDSREFERLMRLNGRLFASIKFEGAVLTGSASLWRDSFEIDLGQVRVDDSASPLTGPGITKEKLKFIAEQPASGTAFAATIYSATNWAF